MYIQGMLTALCVDMFYGQHGARGVKARVRLAQLPMSVDELIQVEGEQLEAETEVRGRVDVRLCAGRAEGGEQLDDEGASSDGAQRHALAARALRVCSAARESLESEGALGAVGCVGR